MKKGAMVGLGCLAAIIVVVIIVGLSTMGTYNSLVAAREGVNTSWAQVENAYQRRADLIPNLVATVKGFAAQESEVLQAVTASRAQAGSMKITPEMLNDPAALEQFQQAQAGLTSALSRLMVVVERYPELKSNQNFLDLQVQIEGTENRINTARNRFNEAAQSYNTRIMQFPGNIFARIFGFQEKAYFESTPGSEEAPVVDFSG